MKTLCVDLDGVLAQYDGWKGEPQIRQGASTIETTKRKNAAGGHCVDRLQFGGRKMRKIELAAPS